MQLIADVVQPEAALVLNQAAGVDPVVIEASGLADIKDRPLRHP